MKITTRMEKIKGVERAEWNWKSQELIIYKKKKLSTSTLILRIRKTLTDIGLQDSIEKISFIELELKEA